MLVLHRLFALGCLVAIGVAVSLPSSELSELRSQHRGFGRAMNWVEGVWPAFGTVHVLLFALVGFAIRIAFPRTRLSILFAGLATFAASSELVQFAIPGRAPRVSDFGYDMLGALLGVGLAAVTTTASTRYFARRQRSSSESR